MFRHIRRGDNIQSNRINPHSTRCIIQKRSKAAVVEGFISGHSLRVGSAVSLAQAGATVVDMQVAGRWKSSQMPAHYAKAELRSVGLLRGLRMGSRNNQLYSADDSHQTTRTNVVTGRYSMKADENRNSETGYSGLSMRDRIRTT